MRYDKEHDASELRAFQETIQEWYGLEWNFQGPIFRLDFMDLKIVIKESMINTILFKNNSIYTYTSHHMRLTHKESTTGSSVGRFTSSPICVMKKMTIKA